jgi:uncharacterized DUF497 family protein
MAHRLQDPYADLYYELDLENGGVGDVRCEIYEWDRAKSNANVREKGFSFYLARTIFYDRAFTAYGDDEVVNGERRVKLVGHPFGRLDVGLLVVVNVALDGEGIYRRIISAWENESLVVEEAYNKHRRWVVKSNVALRRDLAKMMEAGKSSSDYDPLWRFRKPRHGGKA